jgi:DNA-binding response OmpR family regulator
MKRRESLSKIGVVTPSCRILVADSDAPFQAAFGVAAEHAGHTAIALTNIDEAAAVASRESPDLILLDLAGHAPTGRAGRDILAELKRLPDTERIPVLVYSSHAVEFDRRHALELGAEDFVLSPVDPTALIAKIERVVYRTSSGKFHTSS